MRSDEPLEFIFAAETLNWPDVFYTSLTTDAQPLAAKSSERWARYTILVNSWNDAKQS